MSERRTVPEPNVLGHRSTNLAETEAAALNTEIQQGNLAETEAAALDSRIDISKRAKEHLREEKFRDLFAWGMRFLIRTAFVITVGAVIAFGWHHLMPEKCLWLSDNQLTAIQTFLFSSAVVGVILSYMQKRL